MIVQRTAIKHDFILRLKSNDIVSADKLLNRLLLSKEFEAIVVTTNVFEEEQRAAYRIKISTASLIHLKKVFDDITSGDACLELFEFKEW